MGEPARDAMTDPAAGGAAGSPPAGATPAGATPTEAGPAPETPGQRTSATRRGLALGLIISVVLSAALVIPGAKAGITPGVSPLVVLFGWVVFGVALGPRLKRFLAIAQVTGSAGAAVTAGVVFTAPILQVLAREAGLPVPPVDVGLLILASLAGALLGFGFVGLATKRFLMDARLPAPEAVACDRLIETAVQNPDQRPRLLPSLVAGLLGGFAVNAAMLLHWMQEEVYTVTLHLGGVFGLVPAGAPDAAGAVVGAAPAGGESAGGGMDVDLPLPVAPIYLGIGALLTLPTGLLIFAGGFVNAITTGYSAAAALPDTTFRWVGGAAMTVAVLYSLIDYAFEGRRIARGERPAGEAFSDEHAAAIERTELLEQSAGIRRLLYASLAAGTALLLAMMVWIGAPLMALAVIGAVAFVLVFLLSGLGALLSLQVGSSTSPVSGTVFMGMLALSLTALGVGLSGMQGVIFLVPIVVAACVAICAANDSSQDYKTMQLNGYTVTDGFVGQLLGLVGGAVAVPLALWLADNAYHLGTPDLPVPQASFFATVLNSLFLKAQIPWGPVAAGAALGLVSIGVEAYGKRRGVILSSLAFAVGIYLPSVVGTGILLGALARYLATRRVRASTHEGILVAAGLITGDALAALALAVPILMKVDTDAWGPDAGQALGETTGSILLAVLCALILFNYVPSRRARR